jgi:16S rRNA (cytidine1402-2'-O)-methyltransferase
VPDRGPSGREPQASGGRSSALVLVGTPIGNLGDLSPRAVEVLRDADLIYAEDTRRTRGLLSHCDIPARDRLRTLHRHNEAEMSATVVEQIANGARVAYVSDAGMPGISDPGERLVRACVDAQLVVECVPGPSAVVTALVLSGLPAQPFTFFGFLDRKGRARREQLQSIASARHTSVLFETANRLAGTLTDLRGAAGADRPAAVLRELTKLHESAYRGSLDELIVMVESAAIPTRGECVLVVGGQSERESVVADDNTVDARIDELLATGLRVRDVADAVHVELGVDRRAAYDRAAKRRPAR